MVIIFFEWLGMDWQLKGTEQVQKRLFILCGYRTSSGTRQVSASGFTPLPFLSATMCNFENKVVPRSFFLPVLSFFVLIIILIER